MMTKAGLNKEAHAMDIKPSKKVISKRLEIFLILQLYIVTFAMNRKEKLIARFLSMPSDFRYDEMVKLLVYFDYDEVKKGKTSGSRVKFMNPEGILIMLHKPHPTRFVKHYQLKQIKEVLDL